MSDTRAGGFALLEVVPALLLLGAVLLLALRMLVLRHALEERMQVIERASASFPLVWRHWEGSGGTAALARYDSERGVDVIGFPDTTWLPAQAGQGFQWRRIPAQDSPHVPCWDVEFRAGNGRWRWWMRIPGDFARPAS